MIAVALGSVAAIVLLVPTAAYQYRLDGRLQPRDLAVLLSGAVYALALWTYTLLPVPVADSYRCKGENLTPFGTIDDIWTRDHAGGLLAILREPALLQVALNVLLFVPLGYFLRVIVKRGVVTAAIVGLAVSLLVELTQLTGDWHLYACAYRKFDVDDLMVNTLGAIGGSLLSYVFLDRRDDTTPPLPSTVSLGRRLMSLVSDALFGVLVGGAVAAGYRGITVHGPGSYDRDVATVLLIGVPFVIEAASVLLVGRTIGEHVVAVRAVAHRPARRTTARAVKLLVGLTPAYLLVVLSDWSLWWAAVGLPVVAVANVVAAWRTEQHRGLSHVVAGMDLRIAAEESLSAGRRQNE